MPLRVIIVLSLLQLSIGVHQKQNKCTTRKVNCASSTHQSYDGACNNLENPTQGATNTVLNRLLPPEYDDLKDQPRSQGVFRKLPSTRSISNTLEGSKVLISSDISHMHVIFGQLLAHDIVITAMTTENDGSELDCNCYNPNKDCINIEIPFGDVQRREDNVKCMPLARSKAATGADGCEFPYREQVSELSSVIDASFAYGKSDEEARELRDLRSPSGELRTSTNPASGRHGNLPNQDHLAYTGIADSMQCPIKVHTPSDIPCFVAGDVRANENPGIISLHTIMVRYHNHLARSLKSINKAWTGDEVFHTTRRIVSAVYQSITYREYVPPLLGPLWIKRFGLKLFDGYAYWNGYDKRYNVAITNEFATAALRYAHSQVSDVLSRPDSFLRRGSIPDVTVARTFFTSDAHLNRFGGGSGAFLRGLMTDNAQKTDPTMIDALRNQLYAERNKKFGLDLFAINMQRGRDHGLPGYNKYRELCGLPKANSFYDLSGEMPSDVISRLKQIYDSVGDIDLYAGGIAENHVEGGQVGPTFACILAYGFRSLRMGDRYWHENKRDHSSFTPQQLAAIRNTTFASILCQVGEDMKIVAKKPLIMKDGKPENLVSCSSIPGIDLYAWKQDSRFHKQEARNVEYKWTVWFVTKYTNINQVDVQLTPLRVLETRPDEICEKRLGYKLRTVPHSRFIQIQFACPAGSIKFTDFPFQLSQNHYWSDWVLASSSYGHESSVAISEFKCEDVVAIQAMSGKKFASETGDVFEKFSPRSGFLCRDNHQINGKCHKYRVRALCLGGRKNIKEKTSQNGYREPPGSGSLNRALNIARSYCSVYNVCCNSPVSQYIQSTSFPVLKYASNLCRQYGVCCRP
uniref:peroxidasin-like n=1 Tax=Styela clava TaxID=7725 RepID=UPI001939A32B|nr:peroxidasin-like [Styela clava]